MTAIRILAAVVVLASAPVVAADSDALVQDARLRHAIASFRSKVALNAPGLDHDPYANGGHTALAAGTSPVCAVGYESDDRIRYRLETFATSDDARRTGYAVTHAGRCGTCSTLQDLAAYLARPDLTAPVRSCAVRGITRARTLRCLKDLGFSEACALTWYYNARNTRRRCFGVCMRSWALGEPSNEPDGSLNDCLRCDEDESGPVFKAVAGRTRRNSGIRSSIDRADGEVYPLTHDYY